MCSSILYHPYTLTLETFQNSHSLQKLLLYREKEQSSNVAVIDKFLKKYKYIYIYLCKDVCKIMIRKTWRKYKYRDLLVCKIITTDRTVYNNFIYYISCCFL